MSEKLVKILAVVFLTLLIWAWAYMSQEETFEGRGVLEVDATSDPSFLVTFPGHVNSDNKVPLEVTFVGSPTKVSELRGRYRALLNDPERERLNFGYNPQEQGHTEAGIYTIDVLDFLSKHGKSRDLALTLESCDPKRIEVQIEILEKKTLTVECRNEEGYLIKKGTRVDPARVSLYVNKDYTGPAYVTLTELQIEQALLGQPVSATPYVQFSGTPEIREADTQVSITLTEQLDTKSYQPQSIGFVISPELMKKIKSIELDPASESKLREATRFNTSVEALEAYKKMPYHILIEIRDTDLTGEEIPNKKVIYNFPVEYVRTGQIELVESSIPKTATITVVPVTTTVTP